MSYVAYEELVVTASSSGSITTYSAGTYTGFVHAVRYVPTHAGATSGNISSGGGGTMAITSDVSGLSILSLADCSSAGGGDYYPRNLNSDLTGAATTGASAIPLFNERFKVVMSSGSTTADTKSAHLYFYVG